MAKRSCDFCVQRKTRCDGGLPCRKCVESKPSCACTYLRPVLKRGPKTSRIRRRLEERRGALSSSSSSSSSRGGESHQRLGIRDEEQGEVVVQACHDVSPDNTTTSQVAPVHHDLLDGDGGSTAASGQATTTTTTTTSRINLPASMFASILKVYHSRMYSVWPVVDATTLLARLEKSEEAATTTTTTTTTTAADDETDADAYTLATALSAATMAQLNLPAVKHIINDGGNDVDSAYMEKECLRMRNSFNYREHASTDGVLASFFLHVYHAKIDNRRAAMMFLQEAISLARLLHMDDDQPKFCSSSAAAAAANDHRLDPVGDRKRLIYLLLWVSERFYHQTILDV